MVTNFYPITVPFESFQISRLPYTEDHHLREALVARCFPEPRHQLAAIAAEQPVVAKEDALRDDLIPFDAQEMSRVEELLFCSAGGKAAP